MINKVILLGNLGADPTIRSTRDGKKIASLSVATSESWKDKSTGERKSKTEWHRVTVFNDGLASVCERYLRKGSKVYIEGKLQTRKWQDQSGADRYSTDVALDGFGGVLKMLDGKGGGSSHDDSEIGHDPASEPAHNSTADIDDDIPF